MLIILSLACFLITLVPPKQTSAVVAPIARVIAGEAVEGVFISIAEKAGTKYAGGDSFYDAMQRSNYKLIMDKEKELDQREYLTRYENYEHEFKQKPQPVPGRPGVGKIILSAGAFLTGVDLVYEAVTAFDRAVDEKIAVDLLVDSFTEGNSSTSFFGDQISCERGNMDNYVNPTHVLVNKGFEPVYRADYTAIHPGNLYPVDTAHSNGCFLTLKKEYSSSYEFSLTSWYTHEYPSGGVRHEVRTYGSGAGLTVYKSILKPSQLEQRYVKGTKLPSSHGMVRNIPPFIQDRTQVPERVEIFVPIKEDGYPTPEPLTRPEAEREQINDPTEISAPAPTDQPDLDGDGQPDPAPEPDPDPDPDPEPDPGDTGGGDTGTPPGEGEDSDTPTKRPEDEANRWGQLVTTQFPFSLPWDIFNMIKTVMADPVRPEVNVDENFMGIHFKFSHDFKWMDSWAPFFRTFILISFSIFLIMSTRRLMGGGQ
jgi:hypothetical protein